MRKIVTFLLIIFFSIYLMRSQNSESFLEDQYSQYFQQPRTSIYLHLNKHKFNPTDKIWFKAYLFEQKQAKPFYAEKTLYCGLYDKDGNLISKFAFLLNNGITHGNIPLNNNLPPGKYFIKAYTNWMKNFKTSSPFSQQISILNLSSKADFKDQMKILISTEAKNLVLNTNNTIGFKIDGYSSQNSPINDVKIIDLNDKETGSTILFHENGEGKFVLFYRENQTYLIKITLESGEVLEKELPSAISNGIAMNTNNFLNNKVVMELSVDDHSLPEGDFFYLLLHKNGELHWKKFAITNASTFITFEREKLSQGLYIITLMDENYNSLAERLIFNPQPNSKPEIEFTEVKMTPDSVHVRARLLNVSEDETANLSLSIFPSEGVHLASNYSINPALLVDPYIEGNLPVDFDLFRKPGELDLILFNKGWSNLKWNDILSHKPVIRYQLEKGVKFEGRILNKQTPEEPKNLIFFRDNITDFFIVQTDSSGMFASEKVLFNNEVFKVSILEKDGTLIEPDLFIEFDPISHNASDPFVTKNSGRQYEIIEDNYNASLSTEAEELNEILITDRKQEDNRVATGAVYEKFKVTSELIKHNPLVTDILRKAGFKVRRNGFYLSIGPKTPSSKPPKIYLNNFEISDNSELANMPLSNIDEIYYEHMGAEGNPGGTIRIFEKVLGKRNNEKNFKKVVVNNAFRKSEKYQYDKEEKNMHYGFWIPNIQSSNGYFNFSFPRKESITYELNFEGFTINGELISTKKEIKSD